MAINPFEFFKVGQEMGRSTSPVSGVGSAIRGVLEQAQRAGLIQAQSSAQFGGALELANAKSALASSQLVPQVDMPIDASGNPLVKRTPGGVELIPKAHYDRYGRVVGYDWVNARAANAFETFGVGRDYMDTNPSGGVQSVEQADDDINNKILNLMNSLSQQGG